MLAFIAFVLIAIVALTVLGPAVPVLFSRSLLLAVMGVLAWVGFGPRRSRHYPGDLLLSVLAVRTLRVLRLRSVTGYGREPALAAVAARRTSSPPWRVTGRRGLASGVPGRAESVITARMPRGHAGRDRRQRRQ
jgi:hypothetical protein